MLARYYSASSGRFLSVDPSSRGINPLNPQTWNRHSYVLNNPLRFTDPDGLVYTSEEGKKLKKDVQATGSKTGSKTLNQLDASPQIVDTKVSDKALVAVVDTKTGAIVKDQSKEVPQSGIGDAKAALSKNLGKGQEAQVLPGNYSESAKSPDGSVTSSTITIYMGSQADGPTQLRNLTPEAYKQTVFVHESSHGLGRGEDAARATGTAFRAEAGYTP